MMATPKLTVEFVLSLTIEELKIKLDRAGLKYLPTASKTNLQKVLLDTIITETAGVAELKLKIQLAQFEREDRDHKIQIERELRDQKIADQIRDDERLKEFRDREEARLQELHDQKLADESREDDRLRSKQQADDDRLRA